MDKECSRGGIERSREWIIVGTSTVTVLIGRDTAKVMLRNTLYDPTDHCLCCLMDSNCAGYDSLALDILRGGGDQIGFTAVVS
jgi:hypothetical protein